MNHLTRVLLTLAAVGLILPTNLVAAFPSQGFTMRSGDWYDSFGIDRNSYSGPHGYLPSMATETIGENRELAYGIGVAFSDNYVSETRRAEVILQYVQTWVEYGYDAENVFQNGVAQDEWAWNADELARMFNESTGIKAVGDCEDMAFLCATIYTGAGIEAALVDAPDHVACLIWLPSYPNADNYFDLTNDDKGAGWIWIEATGKNNPLGWTPPDYEDGDWEAYFFDTQQSAQPVTSGSLFPGPFSIDIDTIVIAIIVVAVIAFLASASTSSRKRGRYPPPPGYY